jgi:hypothetical protein
MTPFEEAMHYIAQGAINISEGLTTVEDGSPVHQAMKAMCEMVSQGVVTAKEGKAKDAG